MKTKIYEVFMIDGHCSDEKSQYSDHMSFEIESKYLYD